MDAWVAAIRCHLSGLGTLTLSLPSAAGGGEASARGKPTGAMGVSDFLDKGPGGAQLPRKRFVLCGAAVSPAPSLITVILNLLLHFFPSGKTARTRKRISDSRARARTPPGNPRQRWYSGSNMTRAWVLSELGPEVV